MSRSDPANAYGFVSVSEPAIVRWQAIEEAAGDFLRWNSFDPEGQDALEAKRALREALKKEALGAQARANDADA